MNTGNVDLAGTGNESPSVSEDERIALDAKRYRWLREHSFVRGDDGMIEFGAGYRQSMPGILDAAIDAEIKWLAA